MKSTPDARERYAVAWLAVFHAMLVAAVCALRIQEPDWKWAEVASVSVCRSQICLLCIWFAAGHAPFSWRCCSLLAGSGFVFTIFGRSAYPDGVLFGQAFQWENADWTWFFAELQPGDLVLQTPIFIVCIAGPVLTWRVIGLLRQRRQTDTTIWKRLANAASFTLNDLLVWTVSMSLVTITLFQSAPYEGWLEEFGAQCRNRFDLFEATRSATPQISLAAGAMWGIGGPGRGLSRWAAGAALALGGMILAHWLAATGRIEFTFGWPIATVSAIVLLSSAGLVVACRRLPERRLPATRTTA